MKLICILFLTLGACTSSTTFSQNNNRISIHTGLFHSFFDGSPILNTNYPNKAEKPFNGLFYNSLGIQYKRKLNSKSSLSVEYNYYYETYQNVHPNLLKNVVTNRSYNTFNIMYERAFLLSKINFIYGGGLNYRYGRESIVVNYGYFYYLDFWETLIEARFVNDVGANLRIGFEYSPLKWLTLYTKFDLIGFVYLHDKKAVERIQEMYSYNKYPHRFDLSWRFGIGFNFGK